MAVSIPLNTQTINLTINCEIYKHFRCVSGLHKMHHSHCLSLSLSRGCKSQSESSGRQSWKDKIMGFPWTVFGCVCGAKCSVMSFPVILAHSQRHMHTFLCTNTHRNQYGRVKLPAPCAHHKIIQQCNRNQLQNCPQ